MGQRTTFGIRSVVILALLAGCGGAPAKRQLRSQGNPADVPTEQNAGAADDPAPLQACMEEFQGEFTASIKSALNKCSGCHVAKGAAAHTKFSADPDRSDAERFRSFLSQVDLSTIESSKILQKPSGQVAHGGGQVLPESSAEFKTVQVFLAKIAAKRSCSEEVGPADSACKADSPRLTKRLWRLSQKQYENTLAVALGESYRPLAGSFADANPTLSFAAAPSNLKLDEISAASLAASAAAIGDKVVAEDSAAKACVAATIDDCVATWGSGLASKLWRRPITSAETAAMTRIFQKVLADGANRRDALAGVVQYALMAPAFLFRFELGDGLGKPGRLAPIEVASLLSYTFWNQPPDAELRVVAESRALERPEVVAAQIERLLRDPRAQDAVADVFMDWLKFDQILTAEKDPALSDGALTAAMRQDLVASARQAITRSIWIKKASLEGMMLEPDMPINASVARWLGQDPTEFGDGSFKYVAQTNRLGVLTHPAFLASNAGKRGTGMVHRGFFMLKQVLGVAIPPPPAGVAATGKIPPGIDPTKLSTRQEFQYLHSSAQACAGCHAKLDPVGGALENFDALGRFRDFERPGVKVDAAGKLQEQDIDISYTDALGFVEGIARSKRLNERLDEVVLGHLLGIAEPEKLPCELRDLRRNVKPGATVLERIEAIKSVSTLVERAAGGAP